MTQISGVRTDRKSLTLSMRSFARSFGDTTSTTSSGTTSSIPSGDGTYVVGSPAITDTSGFRTCVGFDAKQRYAVSGRKTIPDRARRQKSSPRIATAVR